MTSFIYPSLNRTSRNQDQSQIRNYGAFAAALSYILYFANKNRKDNGRISGTIEIYRGLQLPSEEIARYEIGKLLNLRGYTSATTTRSVAIGFAVDKLQADLCPVLYNIKFTGDEGLFYMSDENYSAFKDEDEILIQDGFDYRINSITEFNHDDTGQKITEIQLTYPPEPCMPDEN